MKKSINITKVHHKPFVVISKDRLDGKAKDDFNKHKLEYGGNYFIFTLNTKYDKDSSNNYVAILSDGGKEIKINKLDSSSKDDKYFSHFTGKAKLNRTETYYSYNAKESLRRKTSEGFFFSLFIIH